MSKLDNTLYVLDCLFNTESKDLDFAEIDVFYELKNGNEICRTYAMDKIAMEAIDTIKELQAENERLKQELEKHNLEQQAKGLEDYAKNQSCGMSAVWMLAKAEKLRNQAKEQSK